MEFYRLAISLDSPGRIKAFNKVSTNRVPKALVSDPQTPKGLRIAGIMHAFLVLFLFPI